MAQWWYSAAGEAAGPLDDAGLRSMAAGGELSPTSPVYCEDVGAWHALEAFEAALGLQRNSWGGYYVPTISDPLIGADPTEPASHWQRIAAYLMDLSVIRSIGWLLAFIFAPSVLRGSLASLVALVIVLGALPIAYETMLVAVRGQTVGKRRMGIEVVGCENSELLVIPRAFARSIVALLTWPVNVVLVLCTADRRGLHDRAVNSRVQRVT